jgi:hypothetical protein
MKDCAKENEWINVLERLPKDYLEVLYIAQNEMGNKEIMTGHRENDSLTHCCCFYSTRYLTDKVIVSHWMPLPKLPKD